MDYRWIRHTWWRGICFPNDQQRAAEIPSDHFSLVQFQNISSRVCLLHCLFSNSLKKQENNFVQRLKISEKVANVQKQTL